jgi:hypothetical protein
MPENIKLLIDGDVEEAEILKMTCTDFFEPR